MYIKPFAVEEWMNEYETGARYNIAETCVDSISLDELFALTGQDRGAFLDQLCAQRMTYGDIVGSEALRRGVCGLYRTIGPEDVIPTHGAAGANHHVFCSLVSPGDEIVSIMPTYQQLYSIPEALGARVRVLRLEQENGYLPDPDALRALVTPRTRMICINNPNNPTGALLSPEQLGEIVQIARENDCYLLCDEVYRHLTQEDGWSPSAADLYEKGISVSSMSKVFSLAGLRMGWIATRDAQAKQAMLSHRDYNLISCGMLDDALSALALGHKEALLARNRGIVRENLALLDAWIAENPHFRYAKPKAGTTALVYYDFSLPAYAFCRRLYHETGAFVTPGDCFEQPRSMRIGYASDRETLIRGLEALSAFASKLEREGIALC